MSKILVLLQENKEVERYPISDRDVELLQGNDDLAGWRVFKDLTGKDINDFASIQKGTWCIVSKKSKQIWASTLGGSHKDDLKNLSEDKKTYTDFEGESYRVMKITGKGILLEYDVEDDGI